jgi:hypothetical protein
MLAWKGNTSPKKVRALKQIVSNVALEPTKIRPAKMRIRTAKIAGMILRRKNTSTKTKMAKQSAKCARLVQRSPHSKVVSMMAAQHAPRKALIARAGRKKKCVSPDISALGQGCERSVDSTNSQLIQARFSAYIAMKGIWMNMVINAKALTQGYT